ncbi:DnaJ sub C member 3 [Blyttiomyces sp. JEL0837]|nr:DnaJ sub C member 3 [Blyttiomyces sp. JEL0837]
MRGHWILFSLISGLTSFAFCDNNASNLKQKTVQQLLDEAKGYLGAAKFNEALNCYDAALEKEPSDYLTLFRRATTYLTVGRTESALRDLSSVLELKPKFHQALLQRGKLLLKDCRVDGALDDLRSYLAIQANDVEAQETLSEILLAKEDLVSLEIQLKANDHSQALEILNRLISACPLHTNLRMHRAEIHLQQGDIEMAVADFSRMMKIQPDNTSLLKRLAELHLSLGEISETVHSLKECLKQDPDHKGCKKLFREVKKLDKSLKSLDALVEGGQWPSVIKALEGDNGLIKQVEVIGSKKLREKTYSTACKASTEMKDAAKGIKWCSKALELDEGNVDALCNRAENRIANEEYDEALRDYEKAHNLDQNNRRVHEGYHRAQRLQKMAARKDYYKILGVPRTASNKAIKKAYRKLAQEWHPDKYRGDLDKEAVLKKMSEINEAYETLTDEEKRAKFDNGEDPNDPHQGHQGGHQHPFFQQGGFPFGHGGGSFRFNF